MQATKHFTGINSINFDKSYEVGMIILLPFMGEETDAQRGQVIRQRSLGFAPRLLNFQNPHSSHRPPSLFPSLGDMKDGDVTG